MPARAHLQFACLFAASASFGQSRLAFVENRGQWPERVSFKADAPSATIWLEKAALLIDRFDGSAIVHGPEHEGTATNPVVHHHAVRLRFLGANELPTSEGLGVQRGSYNYFLGKDPKRWGRGAHAFSAVVQHDIYPGIDLRVRSSDEVLKYDLLLEPGADPRRIAFTYDGADHVDLIDGRIVVRTSLGNITEHIPMAYQEIAGVRHPFSDMQIVRAALAEGGRALTLEFIPNDDRVTPPMQAGFAMTMLASTAAGDAYTFAELERMFANAGFAKSELHELPPAQRLVVSYK